MEQHADLAHLTLTEIGSGWDNTLFRLGDDLALRLPRRSASAGLVEHEQQWLPLLAPQLPLPIPVPIRRGRPGCGFPWRWSITRWFPGATTLAEPPTDLAAEAIALRKFLHRLHQPAPPAAPANAWRGVPLAARNETLREHLEQLEGLVDRTAVLRLWKRLRVTPPWPGPPSWIHGDLHPGNLVVHDGRISAVIDFGDLTAGDPATDLSIAWMLPAPWGGSMSSAAAAGGFDDLDADTWTRARGWALVLGLAYLAGSRARGDAAMNALGWTTLNAALIEHEGAQKP
jgi:aminoglycoside phosphotransferase (APT) family kinase protein